MTPLMERFTAVLRKKGMSCDVQFGAMPGASPAAPIFLAQQQLSHANSHAYVMSFDVSKAFDTAPHGALAYLLRHMGVPESLILLFQQLSCESTVRIVTAHGLTEPIRLRRGLRQGSAESAVLYALLLEPVLRELDARAGRESHTIRALIQAYCDDLLLVAHDRALFQELAGLVALYHMGMSLNVKKCRYATTSQHTVIWLGLRPAEDAPWVQFIADVFVPYLGISLLSDGRAILQEKHINRIQSVVGWCTSTMAPEALVQSVLSSVVSGIARFAAPFLSDDCASVRAIHTVVRKASFRSERLRFDFSNVALYSEDGMKVDDVTSLVQDSAIATVASLAHHPSERVRDALGDMLDRVHRENGVCSLFLIPHADFMYHGGSTWEARLLRALASGRVGLLCSPLVHCSASHIPQLEVCGKVRSRDSYTFQGRDICVVAGPAVLDTSPDVCYEDLHVQMHRRHGQPWGTLLEECYKEHLHVSPTELSPQSMSDSWACVQHTLNPGVHPHDTHLLVHPCRHKASGSVRRVNRAGIPFRVGGYMQEKWCLDYNTPARGFVPTAALLFLFADVYSQSTREGPDNMGLPVPPPQSASPARLWLAPDGARLPDPGDLREFPDWGVIVFSEDPGPRWQPPGSGGLLSTLANVPHDPSCAITLAATQQPGRGNVWVFQSFVATATWCAEYCTAVRCLEAMDADIRVRWTSHPSLVPDVRVSPDVGLANAASLGDFAYDPDTRVVTFEPHRYCWIPARRRMCVSASDASP